MSNLKKFVPLLLVIVVVALGIGQFLLFSKVNDIPVAAPIPADGKAHRIGSVTNPDIASPYFSFGDVKLWGAHLDTLASGTSTACALQAPVASSTLLFPPVIRIDVASSGAASVFEWG